FFSRYSVHSMGSTLLIAILTTLLFSLAGLINGIFAKKFDDISFVPMFILTPLSYLGGVFYSVNLLPSSWRYLSSFNPIFYIVNGFRHGILGQSDVMIEYALILLCVGIIILYSFALWLLN